MPISSVIGSFLLEAESEVIEECDGVSEDPLIDSVLNLFGIFVDVFYM